MTLLFLEGKSAEDKGIIFGIIGIIVGATSIAITIITDLLLRIIIISLAVILCIIGGLYRKTIGERIHESYERKVKIFKSWLTPTFFKYFTFSSVIVVSLSIFFIQAIKTVFDIATYIVMFLWFAYIMYGPIKTIEGEKKREEGTKELSLPSNSI